MYFQVKEDKDENVSIVMETSKIQQENVSNSVKAKLKNTIIKGNNQTTLRREYKNY